MPTGVTKVLVKIDLGDHLQNKGELSFAFDREPNNVSKKCVQQADGTWLLSEKTRRNYGSNLYMYGNDLRPANVVGKDLSYDGVRFDETAADGSLDVTLTVTASGSDGLVQGIIVYGDLSALQWATEAVLDDGTAIKSDDEIWAIRWNTPAKTHTVTFKKWNRANYNACFTHFTVLPSVLEFNKSRVRHIESLSQCTGQRDTLWYGVIWNTGSVQIYDTDGEIYDYIRDGIIEDEQMPITIEAKGRYGSTVIQHHLNGSASYIKETRMMEIQLTNKLEQWGTLEYAGRALTEACSAWDLLVEVFGTAGYSESDVEAMCDSLISVRHPVSRAETEMTVEAFFKGVTIPYPYLEESTFREAVTKFCQLGMLWCYCDDNDNIKFVSARPKMLQGERERAYKYPKSRIYGTTSTEVFLKNKVPLLEISCTVCEVADEEENLVITLWAKSEDSVRNETDYPLEKDDWTFAASGSNNFVRQLNYLTDNNLFVLLKKDINAPKTKQVFSQHTWYDGEQHYLTDVDTTVIKNKVRSLQKIYAGTIDFGDNYHNTVVVKSYESEEAFYSQWISEDGTSVKTSLINVFTEYQIGMVCGLVPGQTKATLLIISMSATGNLEGLYKDLSFTLIPYSINETKKTQRFNKS